MEVVWVFIAIKIVYISCTKYTSNANAYMYASASEQRNNSDRKQQKTISEKKSSTFHGNGIIFKEKLKFKNVFNKK